MSIEKTVLSSRNYAAGYVIRRELWSHGDEKPTEMKAAYTPDGDYIGDSKWAYRLCKLRGVKPEKASKDDCVCSIGFCESEQKWYGWSHRAIYGFGIGSEVKRGDCSYHPTDKDDFLLDMVRFWTEPDHLDVAGEHGTDDGMAGVYVTWTYSDTVPNEKIRGNVSGSFQPYPDTWGRGEWTATTIDEAKTMAMDFAEGVS
jgi:hypothetical protein